MHPPLELVVARYDEDLAWLKRVRRGFRVTIYDKGDGSSGGKQLPNQGREAHTYLHHLTERYDEIADLTVFVQGHPFDHAPDLHKTLKAYADGTKSVSNFHWLGFLADTDDACGRRLFVPWSKNPERRELQLEEFHRELFGSPGPEAYRFFVGAQFAVTRAHGAAPPATVLRKGVRPRRLLPPRPALFRALLGPRFRLRRDRRAPPAGPTHCLFQTCQTLGRLHLDQPLCSPLVPMLKSR